MGRDVKRYFEDLHRFLSLGRLFVFHPSARFGRPPRAVRLARGVRQPEGANWHWSWERDKDLWSRTARWRKLHFFQAAAAEQGG